jgi:DNA-binding NtrC family response regulator
MELFEHFIKIIKQRREDVKELMASGAIDSMERYQYMLGQVRTYESLLQEISTLLNKKEQNDSKGTTITSSINLWFSFKNGSTLL